MSKFNVLKYNQVYMAWLGLYSYQLTEPINQFFRSFAAYCVFTLLFVCGVGSFWYFLINWSINVKKSLGAIKVTFGVIQSDGMFLSMGMKMSKIKALHLKLQEIVDREIDNNDAYNIYWANEQKCRKYTKIVGSYVFIHISMFVNVFIYALGCIAFGNYDTSSWNLFLIVALPFDTTHLLGWFITWFILFSTAFSYAISMTSMTSYFMSCCFYIDAICDHFKLIVNLIKNSVKLHFAEKNRRNFKIDLEIRKKLCRAIEMHIEIFETFCLLADIYSSGIFYLLPFNAVFISATMYELEVSISHFEVWLLLWDISCALCGLLWPAITCYFATITTDSIASLGDNMYYESNWYEYSPELQKYVILIIERSQEAVYFNGLGLVHCTLEIFGKLLKTSCSFYVIFRTFAKR